MHLRSITVSSGILHLNEETVKAELLVSLAVNLKLEKGKWRKTSATPYATENKMNRLPAKNTYLYLDL